MDIINDDTFYVILTKNSNANTEKNCEFEVTFDKPIQTRQNMEVALTEIIMPKNIWNIQNTITLTVVLPSFDLTFEEQSDEQKRSGDEYNEYTFTKVYPIYSNNIEDFEDECAKIMYASRLLIKKEIRERIANYKLRGNEWPQITFKNGHFVNIIGFEAIESRAGGKKVPIVYSYFNFDEDLHKKLGFNPEKFPSIILNKEHEKNQPIHAIYKPKFKRDMIYVYTDIIKETYINNFKANILRIFPLEEKKVSYNFENHMFVPLRVDEINSIKISLRDSYARLVKFEGELSLTLLFRPKEYI